MSNLQLIGAVILVSSVCLFIYTEVDKRLTTARYRKLLQMGRLDDCIKLLSRPVTKLVFPRYNRLYMLLTVELALDDTDACERSIKQMSALKLTRQQRMVLLERSFSFFMGEERYTEAQEALGALKQLGDSEQVSEIHVIQQLEILFDIHANKSTAYIASMERELKGAKGSNYTQLCSMLAKQYENKGDDKRASYYLDRVEKNLGLTSSTLEKLSAQAKDLQLMQDACSGPAKE